MPHLTGPSHLHGGRGFTLIELLLVVVLVMLLMGAVIFNFSSLTANAALEEGATRIETLFRFARAQAANTGRRVQVVFDGTPGTNSTEAPIAVRLQWEPDPLEQPGEFQNLPESALQADQVFDLIQIESVELGDGPTNPAGEAGGAADEDGLLFEGMFGPALPHITFFPDGSSDSAQLILVSQEGEQPRRLRLRLNGITGAMSRETLTAEGEDSFDAELEALAAEPSNSAQPKKP